MVKKTYAQICLIVCQTGEEPGDSGVGLWLDTHNLKAGGTRLGEGPDFDMWLGFWIRTKLRGSTECQPEQSTDKNRNM